MTYYFWIRTWMKKADNFQIAKVQPRCLAFVWIFANFSLVFLIKLLLIKKRVITFRRNFSSTIFVNAKYLKRSGYKSILYKSINVFDIKLLNIFLLDKFMHKLFLLYEPVTISCFIRIFYLEKKMTNVFILAGLCSKY